MAAHENLWQRHFPGLWEAADTGLTRLHELARPIALPAEQRVFHAGGECNDYLLVVSGSVRVQMVTESGRELVLYRVGPGQSCILTTSCILSRERYPAEGITESPVQAFALNRREFEQSLDGSAAFRRFVFANLGRRLAEVIQRMESVAFQSIDRRLASYLLTHADASGRLQTTHHELATELGSAREVVSRHLKRMESRGLVQLQRSSILIRERDALQELAQLGAIEPAHYPG